jgi:hypothetical protein
VENEDPFGYGSSLAATAETSEVIAKILREEGFNVKVAKPKKREDRRHFRI